VSRRAVWRFEVPVDDDAHVLELPTHFGVHPPLHVAARDARFVEFWIEAIEDYGTLSRHVLQVFGTGHDLPENAEWRGTAVAPYGLVWHLYQLREPEAQP
jgi:hypothetical protein